MEQNYLLQQLRSTFSGDAWYGKNISDSLKDLDHNQLCRRFKGSYNIVELVKHMLAWRRYTLHVLHRMEHLTVSPEQNFPSIDSIDMAQWTQLMHELRESQEKLEEAFTEVHDLDQKIPAKEQTLRDLMHGIIHHDVYHIGQINLLAKLG